MGHQRLAVQVKKQYQQEGTYFKGEGIPLRLAACGVEVLGDGQHY